MIKIVRFFRGWARVRVRGGYFARFVDTLVKNGITLYSVVPKKNGGELLMPAAQFRHIRGHAFRCQCRIRLAGKGGAPLLLKRDRYLLTRLVALCVSVAVYAFLTTRVVGIFFSGVTSTDLNSLKSTIANEGIYIGAPQDDISEHFAAERIQLEYQNLSWAAVNLYPGFVVVELAEKSVPPSRPLDAGAVAISRYDAVITRIELAGGEAVVDVGVSVVAGDLLAIPTVVQSGVSWTNEVKGSVYGLVRLSESFFVESRVHTQVSTGRLESFDRWRFFDMTLPSVIPQKNGFENYRTVVSVLPLKLFEVELPIARERTIRYEQVEISFETGAHNALSAANTQIAEYERTFLGEARILQRRFSLCPQADGYTVAAEYYCELDIAEIIGAEN